MASLISLPGIIDGCSNCYKNEYNSQLLCMDLPLYNTTFSLITWIQLCFFSYMDNSTHISPSIFDHEFTAKYVDLVWLLRPKLSALQPSYNSHPPLNLPVNIHDFLKLCLDMTDDIGKIAWSRVCLLAWSRELTSVEELANRTKYIQLFLEHGLSQGIGMLIDLITVLHDWIMFWTQVYTTLSCLPVSALILAVQTNYSLMILFSVIENWWSQNHTLLPYSQSISGLFQGMPHQDTVTVCCFFTSHLFSMLSKPFRVQHTLLSQLLHAWQGNDVYILSSTPDLHSNIPTFLYGYQNLWAFHNHDDELLVGGIILVSSEYSMFVHWQDFSYKLCVYIQ